MLPVAATRMVLAVLLVIANAVGLVVPAKACPCVTTPVPSNHLVTPNAECISAPASEKCRRPCCAAQSGKSECCCRTSMASSPVSGSANCLCVNCVCVGPGEVPLSPASERSCAMQSDSTVTAQVPPAYMALPATLKRGRFESTTRVLQSDRITLLNRLTC